MIGGLEENEHGSQGLQVRVSVGSVSRNRHQASSRMEKTERTLVFTLITRNIELMLKDEYTLT